MRYDQVAFSATHNSYSGGPRGSLPEQLEQGVRFVELDVHAASGTFRVGHAAPGHEVALGSGNPDVDQLDAWLALLASWSDAHPGHAPITLLLDAKHALDLPALNGVVARAFGERLFTAETLGGGRWPELGALRGRFVTVLSGDEGTRVEYVRERGASPAVAMDAAGRVVVVYEGDGGELSYFSGRRGVDGRIAWLQRGRYDAGESPAVALADDGTVVAVHENDDWFGGGSSFRVGRLSDDGRIAWSDRGRLGATSQPSLSLDADGVRARFRRADGGRAEARGRFSPDRRRLIWSAARETAEAPFEVARAVVRGRSVTVRSGDDGAFSDVLVYATEGVARARVRHRQLAFVEAQRNDQSELAADGAWFLASSGTPDARPWAAAWRAAGKLVRLWGFDGPPPPFGQAPVAFAATDRPGSPRYLRYCAAVDCMAP